MKFEPGKPVETDVPTVEVDPLPPGEHVFRLVVFNRRGQSSEPDEQTVIVQRRLRPPSPP